MQILGTLSPLAALFARSDSRLKQDIVLLGKDMVTGFNIYEFAYLGSPEVRYRGVMAQEVKEVRPDAVITDSDGFMAVNYATLGVPFYRVPKGEIHV